MIGRGAEEGKQLLLVRRQRLHVWLLHGTWHVTRIGKARHHQSYAGSTGNFARMHQDERLHQIVIHLPVRCLDNVNVLVTNRLANLHAYFAVGKLGQL